jgi:hypothetical protein
MRFKKIPEAAPLARELTFQAHQFDAKFKRPLNYQMLDVDGNEQNINDRSLYPQTEWELKKRYALFVSILKETE